MNYQYVQTFDTLEDLQKFIAGLTVKGTVKNAKTADKRASSSNDLDDDGLGDDNDGLGDDDLGEEKSLIDQIREASSKLSKEGKATVKELLTKVKAKGIGDIPAEKQQKFLDAVNKLK